jgi:cobalt-zinc-cadmium efflux system outer membrane protein
MSAQWHISAPAKPWRIRLAATGMLVVGVYGLWPGTGFADPDPASLGESRGASYLGENLEGLLAAAHRLSPTLRAAALDTAGAAAKAEGADALDDPTISDSYSYYKDPGVYSAHTVLLSQSFPLWGKRGLRRDAAFADVDAARGRERAAQDELDERIKVAYAQYYVIGQDILVNREITQLARRMHDAASARYGQGSGDQTAIIQTLTEATAAKSEAIRLEGERGAARARLNALIAQPQDTPLAEPRILPPSPPEPALGDLLERARSANPMLMAGYADISAARTRGELADKAWYPDITVGFGPLIQTNNRPVGFAASVGFNIPVPWGREASGQHVAAAELSATRQRYEAALLNIEGTLGEALARLHAARSAEALIREESLPEARAAFQSILASYSRGAGDLSAAIAAEHRTHETELTLLQAQLNEHVELAAIERLIGGRL